ncbi:MAG: recombinase family protein [Candidatus Binatus sp.]|uniref:recombinase family protein n=1 Tax=Candidatus Binatus sp. TaxID=2811406 RepID=UPI003C723684
MAKNDGAPKRCAIYTRKSSEEGLEQNFNSLHAQREACEAFIKSQAGEGWRLVKTAYDDGGLSGGTMERPALQRLLADITERLIDVVVVYKVDRLTRSLADFAKMVEVFDARGVSFVAVTQQFNTTTSMGRLTLNVLLSFAQFEREVTGERIRDKIAASKQKGMWMGGGLPLGYDLSDRRLVVNSAEAETVRLIFQLYLELKTLRRVRNELDRRSIVSKRWVSKGGVRHGGFRFGRGALYHLLANPIYVGEIRHKKVTYPGQHKPIIERAKWQRVQEMLNQRAAHPRGGSITKTTGLLMGRLFDENGEPLYSCWAKKGQLRYRYFVSRKLVRGSNKPEDRGWRLPAGRTEDAVTAATLQILSDRAALASTLKACGLSAAELKLAVEVINSKVKSFRQIGTMEESETIIERVELKREGMQITLNLGAMLRPDQFPHGGANLRMTRLVPMQLRRRGVETRLVIPGEAVTATRTDPALLRALARGYNWFCELTSGRAVSTKQIADREGLSDSYVRHVVPLGLLAPAIVESICVGRQSVSLSAERLKDHASFPIEWDAQQQLLSG